ncbi:MAG: DNA primase large subunit PriL [Candidatus Bathyarchaeota archaeon]|nr:DNA primase large subunit PriL [Candidatus Bathyarchaeota archaeon]MDH5494209.1 DNA primase large subunit PriL [Candidatus Bathyarchaeota archaeon]
MSLTKDDLAKYPFLPQAANDIKQLDLTIQELTETPAVIKHAEQRITASFEDIPPHRLKNRDIETASFPVAIMMVAAINDKYLKKRYALHEAKKIYEHLKQEKPQKILQIAKYFKWKLSQTQTKIPQNFKLHFTHYLPNTTTLQQPEWKLINRQLDKGEIYLTQREACRLLQEEIRKYIESKLDTKVSSLPPEVKAAVEKLKNTFTARKGAIKIEEYPKTVDFEAFPPCIKALYNSISSGHHLSHIGRFTLTTFLVNIGMTAENIVDLFRTLSDFNERLTRYQVEHIAGQRGSRTKYRPPKCSTLQTHGVCINSDEDCRKAWSPVVCYKRKLRKNV